MKYKLTSEEDRNRLKAFRTDDPANLADELDLARLQLEKAINDKNQGAATAWATIVTRLAKTHDEAQARRSMFLHRDAVLRICGQLVQLITSDYKALGIAGWEERVEALTHRMGRTIEGTVNSQEEIKELV